MFIVSFSILGELHWLLLLWTILLRMYHTSSFFTSTPPSASSLATVGQSSRGAAQIVFWIYQIERAAHVSQAGRTRMNLINQIEQPAMA